MANAKKHKMIRRDLRLAGFDHKDVAYEHSQEPVFLPGRIVDGNFQYDPQSHQTFKVQKGIPRKMAPCGRLLYHDMMEELRLGHIR